MSIVIVGLGPGAWRQVTLEAQEVLLSAKKVYLRTARHPTAEEIPPQVEAETFDAIYEQAATFQQVYEQIAERIVAVAKAEGSAVYAVPGHPLVAEASVARILALARQEQIPVHIVPGLSFVDSVLPLLEEDALSPGLQIVDAERPAFDPGRPALFCQVFNRQVASDLKLTLLDHYPPEQTVTMVSAAGVPDRQKVKHLPLFEIDRDQGIDHLTCLFVPALPAEKNLRSFTALEQIIARLRAPNGCPWDREQTHESLKPHLTEESYEVLDALDSGDADKLCEELGDLLMQIFIHAQIASEEGTFDIHDVVESIAAKRIRRHPHVFGDVEVASAAEVRVNWEAIKKRERDEGQSMLASLPRAMPALLYGQAIVKRISRVGFDNKSAAELSAEIARQAQALAAEQDQARRSDLIGQLLFAAVGLAKSVQVDPEEALRGANERFRRRFERVEALSRDRALDLQQLTAAERARLWQEAETEDR